MKTHLLEFKEIFISEYPIYLRHVETSSSFVISLYMSQTYVEIRYNAQFKYISIFFLYSIVETARKLNFKQL